MDHKKEYENWLLNADNETKEELEKISLEEEIKDRFYKELEFGTGGLRGVIGAGTNRMNKYVVARATRGLSEYIKNQSKDISKESVVIAYDSRNYSPEFAKTAAKVLEASGIKTYLFDELRPTPELSFAVRYLSCTAGIVITASHNPAKYNGYKIYWSDGGQIPPDIAGKILDEINKIGYFDTDFDNGETYTVIGEDVDKAYIESVYEQAVNKDIDKSDFKLVYTPLHGSGNKPVRNILKRAGFDNVITVKEQEMPDGNFSTVKSPNPEDKECFEIAIEYAKKNDADLIIGTDPDSDRMGIVVKNSDGEYVALTGNQVGIMLMDYILSSKKLPDNGAVITTIVSTKMADVVAEHYGVKLFKTLTGFKYIGEKIHEFEQNNDYTYLFGFEESYGYLAGTYARDKDAVVASMLTAEMAAYYEKKGMKLTDVLESLYEKFGGYYEKLKSITLEGEEGLLKIQGMMKKLHEDSPDSIGENKIVNIIDYTKETGLPKSDVLSFETENGVTLIIRPSGTEPKIKIYCLSSGKNYDDAKDKGDSVLTAFEKICGVGV